MSRTTYWLAVLAMVACGCTQNTPPAAPKAGPGPVAQVHKQDQATEPGQGAAEGDSDREAVSQDPLADEADEMPESGSENGASDADATGETTTAGTEVDDAAHADKPAATQDEPASEETNSEPATEEPAADEESLAGDDTAPEKTVDQLLQEAQQLANEQDIDGMLRAMNEAQKIDPKNRKVLFLLCNVLQYQAAMASQAGKPKDAYPKYQEGATYARLLRDTYPDLNPGEKGLVATMLYNEACSYGVDDDADKAMASLEEAVDAGFEDADQLANDSDLALLHERADFKELHEKLTEKAREHASAEAKELFAKAETFPFDFTLPDLDDMPVSLADYKGKVVIVDIWGTWCPPCRMEIPHFIELKKRYAEKGFDLVGINYEGSEGDEVKQKIADFVKENGINYKCVIGDEATQGQIPKLEGYPTTLFIDRAGKVRLKVVGYHKLAVLDAIVSELLPEEAPPEDPGDVKTGDDDGNATEPGGDKPADAEGEPEADAGDENGTS